MRISLGNLFAFLVSFCVTGSTAGATCYCDRLGNPEVPVVLTLDDGSTLVPTQVCSSRNCGDVIDSPDPDNPLFRPLCGPSRCAS